jgi:hypothetical protein
MPNAASELQIANRFACWLSTVCGHTYAVAVGPNPPDFLLEPRGWLEVTDIFLSNEQAKFLNSPSEHRFAFHCSPDEPARRLVEQLTGKLAKTSYREVYDQRGAGILLLTCQDFAFDEVNLARVRDALASFQPVEDQGFFRTAFFEYTLPATDRIYEVIYTQKA